MSCGTMMQFYAGEDKTLELILKTEDESGCRENYDLTGATQVEVTLVATPDDIVFNLGTSPAVVIDQAILGKIHLDLGPIQTNVMISGPVLVKVTKAGKVKTFLAAAAIRRLEILSC